MLLACGSKRTFFVLTVSSVCSYGIRSVRYQSTHARSNWSLFQSQARSLPPSWRVKEDLKRLAIVRRREQLHCSKDSTESKFRAVRHSPRAHVLHSWLASPIHLVFRRRKSTAKPNDGRQKCGSRNLSVDTQLSCRLLLAFRESMCLNFH